ncbi:hypothetical protein [Paenibacillus polymyxa]|uniref:Uncharacterized protein n=1 Tax=Paenibacillus polymyxa (strain SC2) TaxID=886882 RepID=E3EKM9_PAEPS|nr:hypothetical protein [Paenibacillus polymyxa]ADO59861.1 hypothetical protein PPSC2_25885 [Paenibacillus polymyxa SC2]WPQ59911.1 hypothetical protein SKN87_27085 [Paenibacillus polymyxa]
MHNDDLSQTFIEMIDTRVIVQSGNNPVCIVPNDEFNLKIHQDIPYLTLQDIADQLEARCKGRDFLVDVWEEGGLSGTIYRYNNMDKKWRKHGTTKGFA